MTVLAFLGLPKGLMDCNEHGVNTTLRQASLPRLYSRIHLQFLANLALLVSLRVRLLESQAIFILQSKTLSGACKKLV